ncbi:hypothetical protein ACJMK2_004373, partial [Sinanodonta woodiana]
MADAAYTSQTDVKAIRYARLLEKRNQFRSIDDTLPRYIVGLEDKGAKGKKRILIVNEAART